MKILFLSSWFPYPPDNGSRIRILNLLKQLSKRHELSLLSFTNCDSDVNYLGALESICQIVRVIPSKTYHPWSFRAIFGLLLPRPRWLVDVYSHEMRTLVEDALRNEQFDMVIASQIAMAPYIEKISGVRKVLEELEVSLHINPFTDSPSIFARLRSKLRRRKFALYVDRLLQDEFDGCTVVSEIERSHILRHITPDYRNINVVPNGVDIDYYKGDFDSPRPETLVFTGALSYFANYDALDFFLSEIWPLVRNERPRASLSVTGRTESIDLERYINCEGVTFTGYLDDIRPQVQGNWICIVPLRIGGGTRLKILEAMALGTPVVSTSKGAEGLNVEHGENILIADEPEVFAHEVIRLMEDPDLRDRLVKNARILVKEDYDWQSIGLKLDIFIDQVALGGS